MSSVNEVKLAANSSSTITTTTNLKVKLSDDFKEKLPTGSNHYLIYIREGHNKELNNCLVKFFPITTNFQPFTLLGFLAECIHYKTNSSLENFHLADYRYDPNTEDELWGISLEEDIMVAFVKCEVNETYSDNVIGYIKCLLRKMPTERDAVVHQVVKELRARNINLDTLDDTESLDSSSSEITEPSNQSV